MSEDQVLRDRERAALYRDRCPEFARWAAGYGVIEHTDRTQVRVRELASLLVDRGLAESSPQVYDLLWAADRVASAALWLVVHMTYARRVALDGGELAAEDFKRDPQGHTGGALNMVPAYVGYLAINALTGTTRSWLMGQGHCVAAVDAANLLVGNTTPRHRERYDLTEEGLQRFVRDFYAYEVLPDGTPRSPVGSHVNAHTAGGLIEGGYLGFAEPLYVHMPLPGESLVAFLSDGAFEEQRGGDWAPRWWRAGDCGLAVPIMIANGRRIDQRTTMAQQGGVEWLRRHLRLNHFEPVDIDGRDPADFAWAIHEMEERLTARGRAAEAGQEGYPVLLPHGIAETEKGYGFPGAGTNRAHNLPLTGNPATDATSRREFNEGARRLWVPWAQLEESIGDLTEGVGEDRPPERDHPLAVRSVPVPDLPAPPWRSEAGRASPMRGIDRCFVDLVRANPELRVRVGNPDELRSNRMDATLDFLKHRVTHPEPGVAEAVDGSVITALNEEAVVCAALGNKGGINLVATYEAFGVKMLGALRQELIFNRHKIEAGDPPGWLSLPVLLSSHTWENGKNEQSHQDPTLAEAMLGEQSDLSRVVFPADWNSAVAFLQETYRTHGGVWTHVVPKNPVPDRFGPEQALELVEKGAAVLRRDPEAELLLCAVGAYQLEQALRASRRLDQRDRAHSLVYLAEPGRYRMPRDRREAEAMVSEQIRREIFPQREEVRVFLTHTRPEPLLGALRPLDTGPGTTRVLGYRNQGGTLDVGGMLFANRCTWAHAIAAAATALDRPASSLLGREELDAVRGEGDPRILALEE